MEHAKLQDDRDEFADAVLSPQELEAQFLLWEKTRMQAYLATRKREKEKDRTITPQPTGSCTRSIQIRGFPYMTTTLHCTVSPTYAIYPPKLQSSSQLCGPTSM